MFIPAFYFYQTVGEADVQQVKGNIKASAIMVSLKYKSNSEFLSSMFDAIEKSHLA